MCSPVTEYVIHIHKALSELLITSKKNQKGISKWSTRFKIPLFCYLFFFLFFFFVKRCSTFTLRLFCFNLASLLFVKYIRHLSASKSSHLLRFPLWPCCVLTWYGLELLNCHNSVEYKLQGGCERTTVISLTLRILSCP